MRNTIILLGLLLSWIPAAAQSPLAEAARNGDAALAEKLLAGGADPRAADQLGTTALHEAVFARNTEMIALLLKAGADPSATDHMGWTALHQAATCDPSSLPLLLEASIPIDCLDLSGKTPLMWAAISGQKEALTVLMQRGAKPQLRDHGGRTALDLLAEEAGDMAAVLKDAGLERRPRKLHFVPMPEQSEAPKTLAVQTAPVLDGRAYGQPVLAAVWRKDHAALAAALTSEGGADTLGPYKESGLHLAVERGDVAALDQLLAAGTPVNQQDRSGWTPLLLAAHAGRLDLMERLFKAGADLNLAQAEGINALMWAADKNHTPTVKFLLRNKINRKARDARGRTALDYVNRVRQADLYRMLRQLGLSHGKQQTMVTSEEDYALARRKKLEQANGLAALQFRSEGPGFDLDDEQLAKLLNKVASLLQRNDLTQAQTILEEARTWEGTPGEATTYFEARLAFAQARWEDAHKAYRSLLEMAAAPHIVGEIALLSGEQLYTRELEGHDAHARFLAAWRYARLPRALRYLAQVQKRQDRFPSAIPTLAYYLELLDPEDTDYPTGRRLLEDWQKQAAYAKGEPLGEIGVKHLEHETFLDLNAYRGKVVLLYFWTSWQHARADEFSDPLPTMRQFYKWYPRQPFEIVSITGNSDRREIHKFIEAHKIAWPVYQDSNLAVCRDLLGVEGYPSFLILDHEGKIIFRTDSWAHSYEANLGSYLKEAMSKAKKAGK